MANLKGNPKLETRNPKQIGNPKTETQNKNKDNDEKMVEGNMPSILLSSIFLSFGFPALTLALSRRRGDCTPSP
jgi:hypothetical protein